MRCSGSRSTLLGRMVTGVVVLLMFLTIVVESDSNLPAISLDISRNPDANGRVSGVVVNCSIDTSRVELDKVATLTLLGSEPFGTRNDFDELATLDIWSKSPKLAQELDGVNVTVEGDINSDSPYLTLAWSLPTLASRHVYRCVANGINKDGQAESVSTTVNQVEAAGFGCCKKVEAVQTSLLDVSDKIEGAFNLTAAVSSQLMSLSSKFENVEVECASVDDKVSSQLGSLTDKFEDIENKVSELDGRISSHTQTLTNKVKEIKDSLVSLEQNIKLQFRLLGIDRNRFDVSGLYKDTLYLVSKVVNAFDISGANNLCKLSGGYLVEFDDTQEYQFVFDLVSKTGGADHFWTGGNDIEQEGTFVYFNSKKPVPQLPWLAGEPNNTGNNEDCMEILLSSSALNDNKCNNHGKFVCEVPLEN